MIPRPPHQEETGLGIKAKEPEWAWAAKGVLELLRTGQVAGVYGAARGPEGLAHIRHVS